MITKPLNNRNYHVKLCFYALLAVIWLCTACSTSVIPPAAETKVKALPTRAVKATIDGVVVGGGDKSPSGLVGGPRTYIYEVRADSGEIILVTYVALPPSPAADRHAFRLDFYTGEIKTGDYLKAYGTYDYDTLTLTVVDQGDYIETYPSKP